MAKGDHQFRGRPAGASGGGYIRARTQIGFDNDTREKIAAWAKHNDRSFTAEVRALVDEAFRRRMDISQIDPSIAIILRGAKGYVHGSDEADDLAAQIEKILIG